MARRPDMSCAKCGKPMWGGKTSLPQGQAVCHPCRRLRHGTASNYRKGCRCDECVAWNRQKAHAQYLRAHPDARPRQVGKKRRICEVCGAEYRSTYSAQRTCGRVCGATISGRARAQAWEWCSLLAWSTCVMCERDFPRSADHKPRSCCSPECSARRKRIKDSLRGRFTSRRVGPRKRACAECGAEFETAHPSAKYCRPACARRHAGKSGASRARKRGAKTERVHRIRVFERDRWRCVLCGKRVVRTKGMGNHDNPRGPTLDHLVPISQGGEHTYANVACAHWDCNVRKSAAGGGEQLALVG